MFAPSFHGGGFGKTVPRAGGEKSRGRRQAMTTLTLRRINDDFIVTGPDIEPAKFEADRPVTHGYAETLEAATQAFASNWFGAD
jgi:hypothetical protein